MSQNWKSERGGSKKQEQQQKKKKKSNTTFENFLKSIFDQKGAIFVKKRDRRKSVMTGS